MHIDITSKGELTETLSFLKGLNTKNLRRVMEEGGRMGVEALAAATPRDTGLTAESWQYEIHETDRELEIVWSNSNFKNWANIAVLIQYGHATRGGGWVQGRDYINPAMQPVFDEILEMVLSEVNLGWQA